MRIEVDQDVLVRSGRRLGSIGSQLGMLSDALGAALGDGIASGLDPAGANFGFKYGRQAQEYADALAMATDAHNVIGYLLEATGYNYENADAASTIGGSGPAGGVGGQLAETTAADAPTGPSGAVIPPPTTWAIVQTFLGPFMSWPSGNPWLLRLTAAQWRNLATGLAAFDDDIAALKDAVAQQEIPEGARIIQALSALAEGVTTLSDTATTMAQSIDDFADGVQDTQDAIRRLMDRISLDGLWDTVTGFLTGEGDEILREIAHDVGELLENFQNQVKGVVGLLEELTIALGTAADALEKWIRPALIETFGDGAGNVLADHVTLQTDFSVGAVTGLITTVSDTVALADLDTWKGMAELAASVAVDPLMLPGVLANMGKEFVAWDEWSGDHPGRAAGEAAFNIGLLFVPGGALSKSGSVAKGLSYSRRLLEEGRLPRPSDLPGLGGGNRNVPGLDGIPGAEPGLPNGISAPTSPGGSEGRGGRTEWTPHSSRTSGSPSDSGTGIAEQPTRPASPEPSAPAPHSTGPPAASQATSTDDSPPGADPPRDFAHDAPDQLPEPDDETAPTETRLSMPR